MRFNTFYSVLCDCIKAQYEYTVDRVEMYAFLSVIDGVFCQDAISRHLQLTLQALRDKKD